MVYTALKNHSHQLPVPTSSHKGFCTLLRFPAQIPDQDSAILRSTFRLSSHLTHMPAQPPYTTSAPPNVLSKSRVEQRNTPPQPSAFSQHHRHSMFPLIFTNCWSKRHERLGRLVVQTQKCRGIGMALKIEELPRRRRFA